MLQPATLDERGEYTIPKAPLLLLLRLSRRRHRHSVKRVIKGERDRRRRRKGRRRRRRRLDCRAAPPAAAARRCGDRFAGAERTSDAAHCRSRWRFPPPVAGCVCVCGSQHARALDSREGGPRDGRTQGGLIPFFPRPGGRIGVGRTRLAARLHSTAYPRCSPCRDCERLPFSTCECVRA